MIKNKESVLYCKECGGFIQYDMSIILTSNPPMYQGKCKDCEAYKASHCAEIYRFLANSENKK